MNLQDHYLNELITDEQDVTIYLTNGFQLKGTIIGFDNFVVVVDLDERQGMVYKHAISTVEPLEPINIRDLTESQPMEAMKKPGLPRKSIEPVMSHGIRGNEDETAALKKKRGRPRKMI